MASLGGQDLSGIGFGIASKFAKNGGTLVINGLASDSEVKKLSSELKLLGAAEVLFDSADLSKPVEIDRMFKNIIQKYQRVDVLVNNAGIQFVSPIENFPPEKWEMIIRIDLIAAFSENSQTKVQDFYHQFISTRREIITETIQQPRNLLKWLYNINCKINSKIHEKNKKFSKLCNYYKIIIDFKLIYSIYLLNENKNLRVSYSRSINRPSFFEIVPYKIINEEFTEMGNPDLKHTVADNFDIRYEFFPKPAEQFLIGIFYKNINNPIETGIVDQGQRSFFTPTNFGIAKNYGLELDITKYFFNFGFKFNYTYTNSSITTSKVYYELNTDPNSSVRNVLKTGSQTRQLNGQAANLANLTLIYKNIKNSIDFQIATVYTGDKLFAVSRFLNNDTWQSSFVQLDASLEKKVKKATLFIKANNLLNTPVSLYFKKYNKVNETISGYEKFNNGTLLRKDLNGINIQLGFKFKI